MPYLQFEKPHPLSPFTYAERRGEHLYLRDKRVRGGWRRASGVLTEHSIYYWWFRYLRKNEKYQKAIQNSGRGLKKLCADFGDLNDYSDDIFGFWKWWETDKHQRLFGYRTAKEVSLVSDWAEVENLKEGLEQGNFSLMVIPHNQTATQISRQVSRTLKGLSLGAPEAPQSAYKIVNAKVDAQSLKDALTAWELHQEGWHPIDIATQVSKIQIADAQALKSDRRRDVQSREIDWDLMAEMATTSAYQDAVAKAKRSPTYKKMTDRDVVLEGRAQADEFIDRQVAQAVGAFKGGKKLTQQKNSLRTAAYKLIRKAEANIEATAKGKFCLGHAQKV